MVIGCDGIKGRNGLKQYKKKTGSSLKKGHPKMAWKKKRSKCDPGEVGGKIRKLRPRSRTPQKWFRAQIASNLRVRGL